MLVKYNTLSPQSSQLCIFCDTVVPSIVGMELKQNDSLVEVLPSDLLPGDVILNFKFPGLKQVYHNKRIEFYSEKYQAFMCGLVVEVNKFDFRARVFLPQTLEMAWLGTTGNIILFGVLRN